MNENTREALTTVFTERHAEMYAAKWRADSNIGSPTDSALCEAFSQCVRPAKPEEYLAIRQAIKRHQGSEQYALFDATA